MLHGSIFKDDLQCKLSYTKFDCFGNPLFGKSWLKIVVENRYNNNCSNSHANDWENIKDFGIQFIHAFLVIILHGVRCGMERFLRPPPEMNFSDLDQIDFAERWRRWRETMELYLRLNMADSDEKEQCDAFRYIIGQDSRDIYNTMTFTSSEVNKIDALFAKFEDYYKP